MLPHFIFYITQTYRIYIWKTFSFLSVFYHQGTLDMVQINIDQVVSVRLVGLPVLPVISAPCGHCCEGQVVAQAPYRSYTAFPCPASKEWAQCLSVNCQQTSRKTM